MFNKRTIRKDIQDHSTFHFGQSQQNAFWKAKDTFLQKYHINGKQTGSKLTNKKTNELV